MLKFSEITSITSGDLLQLSLDHTVTKLLIDSRQLVVHSHAVFFAIKGPRHDGNDFVESAYRQGVRNFVVERVLKNFKDSLAEANIIRVQNSLQALQQVAAYHRRKFHLPVLGITGSNAKTIIKEWLYQLMDDKKVVKSPKSYNSQVGVPLSVWQLHEAADLGIFEAGISQMDEMEKLRNIILPTLGIFTNIGSAHDQGFSCLREKVQEKSKLFRDTEMIIYRKEHPIIHEVLSQSFSVDRLLSWSTTGEGNISYDLQKSPQGTVCSWEYNHISGSLILPFDDPASSENLLHCLTFLLLQGYRPREIEKRMSGLQSVAHRLALKKGLNNCHLVDDTYNNDFAGLETALDFLNQQPHGKSKVLILSDIKQAAETDALLYAKVSALINSKGIERFYGIGPGILRHKDLFTGDTGFYLDAREFLQAHRQNSFKDQLILVKGARDFEFEKIVHELQEKHHGTVLEIDLDALTHNLNYFRNLVPATTKLMVMVKAFAYGSGSQEIAHLLQYHGIDYLGVAYSDEGVALRRDGIHIPVMVMNPAPESFDKLSQYQLEPEIYSLELLREFQRYCTKAGQQLPVHLKIDTGMHRLGFEPHEMDALIAQLKQHPLPIASIFSHLAASDDPQAEDFSREQYRGFIACAEKLEAALAVSPLKHLLNSSGILQFPEYHMDMVRLGIGLYGVGMQDHKLRSISSLKTTISQIKSIKSGETIGYGRKGKASGDLTIATIAIGYADGFDRRNSNGVGKVLVGSDYAPVIGNVCMDMTMIDISGIQASVGDTVIIFNENRPIQDLARALGTIPYEILTQVSERVKRVYFSQ